MSTDALATPPWTEFLQKAGYPSSGDAVTDVRMLLNELDAAAFLLRNVTAPQVWDLAPPSPKVTMLRDRKDRLWDVHPKGWKLRGDDRLMPGVDVIRTFATLFDTSRPLVDATGEITHA